MINSEQDFYDRLQSCITPIYVFDQKRIVKEGEEVTTNGTVTLFQKDHKRFGITNYHVYAEYEAKKKENPNTVCQLGYNLQIDLDFKTFHKDEKNDLIIFFLEENELSSITDKTAKSGFRLTCCNLENLIKKYQKDDPKSWIIHFAGYPGYHKITKIINSKTAIEDFGIFLSTAPATYQGSLGKNDQISLNFSRVREAIEEGKLRLGYGNLEKSSINFGGISGGPIFARVDPYRDDLTLLGIIYEGSGGSEGWPELIFARPINLINDILMGN